MDEFWMRYDGQLTDDEPVMVARYSAHWRGFLLGVAEILRNPDLWHPDDDVELALSQVSDLLFRLIGEEESIVLAYPENVFVPIMVCDWITAGGLTYSGDNLMAYNHFYYNTVPLNGEDVLRFSLPLSAGDWIITTLGHIAPNLGKFRWVMNGVAFDAALDIDMYNVATIRNYVFPRNFSVASDGLHTFVLRNVGKNAASSNYYFILTGILIRKNP